MMAKFLFGVMKSFVERQKWLHNIVSVLNATEMYTWFFCLFAFSGNLHRLQVRPSKRQKRKKKILNVDLGDFKINAWFFLFPQKSAILLYTVKTVLSVFFLKLVLMGSGNIKSSCMVTAG